MTEPATYSEAELAQASAEWEADDAREAAAKAAKVRQSRRKTIMLMTLCGVGGLVIVAGAVAFSTFERMSTPKPKKEAWKAECGQMVDCRGVIPGPSIAVPSLGVPTIGGYAQHRDYDPVVDATVVTDRPADAISKLAATFKPKAGKRYKVEVKVTQDE